MRSFPIYAAAALALCLATDASAQKQSKVTVLSVPDDLRQLSQIEAVTPLAVPYHGKIAPGRHIFARVFYDSVQDLTVTFPQQTKPGQCVVYARTGRIPVTYRQGRYYDGQLILDEVLVRYIEKLRSQSAQTIVLVFEDGEDPDSGRPLYLKPGNSVDTYFSNRMELPIIATLAMRDQWRKEDRENAKESSGGWFPWFGGKKVEAKATANQSASSPPDQPKWPTKMLASSKDCATATAIPFVDMNKASETGQPDGSLQAATVAPDPFSPVAERDTTPCGQ
jgi:hypothetical protein